jgi:hypothetical protein
MIELPPLQPQQPPPEGQRPQPGGPPQQPAPQGYPPPQYSYPPPPHYPYPPTQQPPPPPPPGRRWLWVVGGIFLILVIVGIANGSKGSAPVSAVDVPQTTTDEFAPSAPSTEPALPVTTEAPPSTPRPTRAPVVAAPADNGWADVTVTGCSTHTDFGMTFAEASVRITNHTSSPQSYIVTVELNNARGDRIGEATAVSTDLPPGRIVTVTGHGTTNTPGAAGMRCELSNVLRTP